MYPLLQRAIARAVAVSRAVQMEKRREEDGRKEGGRENVQPIGPVPPIGRGVSPDWPAWV